VTNPNSRDKMELPPRPFLYTLDQLATILSLSEAKARAHVYFDGRSIGRKQTDQMMARNIAPATDKPDWRIAEQELIRWMKHKGFKFYARTTIRY
jgi:hypothetical protein